MSMEDNPEQPPIEIIGAYNRTDLTPSIDSAEVPDMQKPWIMVFGTRLGGAPDWAQEIQRVLDGNNIQERACFVRRMEDFNAIFSDPVDPDFPQVKIPAAVFLLEEIRIRSESGINQSVKVSEGDKIYSDVQGVCNDNSVQFFYIKGKSADEILKQISDGLGEIGPASGSSE